MFLLIFPLFNLQTLCHKTKLCHFVTSVYHRQRGLHYYKCSAVQFCVYCRRSRATPQSAPAHATAPFLTLHLFCAFAFLRFCVLLFPTCEMEYKRKGVIKYNRGNYTRKELKKNIPKSAKTQKRKKCMQSLYLYVLESILAKRKLRFHTASTNKYTCCREF